MGCAAGAADRPVPGAGTWCRRACGEVGKAWAPPVRGQVGRACDRPTRVAGGRSCCRPVLGHEGRAWAPPVRGQVGRACDRPTRVPGGRSCCRPVLGQDGRAWAPAARGQAGRPCDRPIRGGRAGEWPVCGRKASACGRTVCVGRVPSTVMWPAPSSPAGPPARRAGRPVAGWRPYGSGGSCGRADDRGIGASVPGTTAVIAIWTARSAAADKRTRSHRMGRDSMIGSSSG